MRVGGAARALENESPARAAAALARQLRGSTGGLRNAEEPHSRSGVAKSLANLDDAVVHQNGHRMRHHPSLIVMQR